MYTNMKNIVGLAVVLSVVIAFAFTGVAIAQQQQDSQRINTITVEENGDATWNIEIREELNNEDQVSTFQSYVDQVENNSNNETKRNFRSDLSGVVEGANSSFERSMSFESLTVEAEVAETATGTFGVTNVSFTWTNYARTDSNGNITVGEILSDGYTISDGERLRIVLPESYSYDSDITGGEVNDNVVEWNGPYAFNDVELTFTESDNSEDSIPIYAYGVVFIALLIVSGGVIYGYKFIGDSDESEEESGNTESNDLQTEEEKLVSLIEENDGRVKQKVVSEKFDWSDAKVSRITNKLEEADLIDKLTIGRENVLDLKEDE